MTIELINQYGEKRTVYPLDRDILIPHPFNLNDTLQHLDGQINCAIPYDPEIHKFLVENSFLKSKVYNEETQTIFTGVVKDGLEWIDNGNPEPLNEISLTLQDNSYYLNNTPEEDITYINLSLTTILADVCKRCNLQIGSNLPTDKISVAQIKQNTTYLNFINDILFQHCYAFGFDANGVLQTINIKEMETSEVFDDFFTGLKFTKTTKNYNAIHLNYGELTVKHNEQVYFEGGEISSDNTIQPIIIQPNAYYPPEATPIIEEQDGKVIQNFLDGFAQTITLFNGEKKYQRSKNTELIYTEDHVVTKDYSDNLTLDRTDFTATSASVRFYNNSATDAELYQLAIRATAYYRRQKKLILGDGKKFEYEAIYIYDSQRASTFANFLSKYFLGGNYKIAARTEKNFLPGTKLTLKTGISGIATKAIVISSTYNPREQNYNITFLTEDDLALSPKFYQDRHTSQFPGPKGDKGDSGIGIKSITEYYLATKSSSGITNATDGFTPAMQSLTSENKYLWNYELITYTDLTTSKTNAVIIGVYGDKGDTGTRGSLEFSGTEINAISDITEATYTITTASTGITSATMPILVGDTYINITTQDVWICSTAGTPTTAKWKYQGRRCSDKDDSNRFRMFTPATDNGLMSNTLTKQVVKGENPFGKIDDLLKITNTNGIAASRYTLYVRRTKIDPKKTYRHVTYIKQEDANYTDFIGIAGYESENSYCLSLSGSSTKAAYFTSTTNFGTLGRWFMVVGYIVANGTTTAPTDSGVYDMVTKQKIREVTNYQWKPNVTFCNNNGCLIRYTAEASTKTGTAYLYDVRLDEVNGTEPTLNELLNLDTTTKSKGTWTASTIYNTGDIVYLNGNSYICTVNHTSGTSFSTTNWNLIASKGADGKDGTDGKNAITMTSATTPNGEYNGQIGIWQGQVYQWNGTGWVLTSGVLPTDPVLHYSFDELPDLPDGTSIIAKNRNFVDQDWHVLRGDPTLENGCIKMTKNVTTDNSYVCFRIKSLDSKSGFNSKTIKIRIFVKASVSTVRFRALNQLDSSEFFTRNIATNQWVDIVGSLPSENVNNPWVGCMFPTGTEDNYFLVEQMYIGIGLYSSPLIDNAGKNNAKIAAATSVITETGKGVRFFAGKNGYGVAKAPLIHPSQISFSVWFKTYDTTATQTIAQCRTVTGSGFSVFIFSEKIRFDFGGVQSTFNFSPSSNRNYHVVVIGTTEEKKLYIDGKLVQTISGDFSETPNLAENIWFGSSSVNGTSFNGNTLNGELDDFQIFDRALSEQEVLGLYLTRGNTPKQYTRADYEIDLLPETIPQHTPKYLGPVSSESQINALEKKVGDWCLFTGTTTSLYQLGQVYKWNGLIWEIDSDDGHRAQTINDCLELLKQGKEATTYASKFVDLLVSQEVLAEKMSALEVRFQNFVASYQNKDLQNGDEYIYMGKNPLKKEENASFEFTLGQFFGNHDGVSLHKPLAQLRNNNSTGDLVLSGKVKSGGIDTFSSVFGGYQTQFLNVSGALSYTTSAVVSVASHEGEVYVIGYSNDTLYIDKLTEENTIYKTTLVKKQENFSNYGPGGVGAYIGAISHKKKLFLVKESLVWKVGHIGSLNLSINYYDSTKTFNKIIWLEKIGKYLLTQKQGTSMLFDPETEEYYETSITGNGVASLTDDFIVSNNQQDNVTFSSIYIYDKNGNYLTQKSLVGKSFVNRDGQVETITNASMTGLTAFNGKIFSVYKSLYVCMSEDFGDSWTYVSEIKGIALNGYNLEGLFVLMTEFGLAISNDNGETFSPFLAKEIGRTPTLPLLWESKGKRSLFFAIPGEVNSSSFASSYIDVVEIRQQDLSALPFINGRTYSMDTSTYERNWPFIRIGKDFIIQHGSWPLAQTLAANSTYTVDLTFPVPFYDYDYNLIVSYYGANMDKNILVGVDSQTPTGAVIKIKNISGSATSNPVNSISWIALGKPQ